MINLMSETDISQLAGAFAHSGSDISMRTWVTEYEREGKNGRDNGKTGIVVLAVMTGICPKGDKSH